MDSNTINSETLNDNTSDEEKKFLDEIEKTIKKYFTHGPRSPLKMADFHKFIAETVLQIINELNQTPSNKYEYKLEMNVQSINSSGNKRCDIVILKNGKPNIIFPVKFPITNYKQNRNNSWENLTGEVNHLKWANDNLHILPINILCHQTPYLTDGKKIKYFETITDDDIKNYKYLIRQNLCPDIINYIVDIEHSKSIGEEYNEIKSVNGFNEKTKYRPLKDILKDLI